MSALALAHLAVLVAPLSVSERLDLARDAHVRGRLVHRLAATVGRQNVRPFDGAAFICLCASFGLDPLSGEACEARAHGGFSHEQFACAVKIARFMKKLSLRAAAKEFGVEQTALNRMENAIPISVPSTLQICRAMSRHPFDFLLPEMFHGLHKVQQVDPQRETEAAQ